MLTGPITILNWPFPHMDSEGTGTEGAEDAALVKQMVQSDRIAREEPKKEEPSQTKRIHIAEGVA